MEIIIKKSSNPKKKFEAIIGNKTIKFGAAGYSDYTIHEDPERKQRYIDRHKKNEDWGKSDTDTPPGFYSRWLLWNKKHYLNQLII